MELNPFVWRIYRESLAGKKALATSFVRFARLGRQPGAEGWRGQVNAKLPILVITPGDPKTPGEAGGTVPLRRILFEWFKDLKGKHTYERRYRELLEDAGAGYEWEEGDRPGKLCCVFFGGDEDEGAQAVAASVGSVSTTLHWLEPDEFSPYYFEGRFTLFSEICRTFGIDLPVIPGKLQKRERAIYYLAVNSVLQEFRQRNGLSPQELNAFLYDFAPSYLAVEQDKELPAPQRAWFLMAGVGTTADFDLLDHADETTETSWRGHRDARRGDIAIVWCSSPRAYLHSIWRIVEDGYDDPFTYWYTLVHIGRPMPVHQLKIKDLKGNPVLAKSPMVSAHFQGCAGKYFPPVDYAALLEEVQRRGTDIGLFPRINIPALPALLGDEGILDERQVELRLIEPLLLNKLGYYEESHWRRQVRVRMGRGENVYPDYVIGYRGDRGEERADIIIESKYRIATQKELSEAFLQGRSYALRLQASWLLFGALEGVWLMSRTDDFKLQTALHWSWEEILEPETFSVLEKTIGSKMFLTAR